MNKLETMLALSDCLHLYHMNSGIDRMAKCLADPTFDSMAIHYTRERIVSDGVEEMRTTFRGKSNDSSGKVRTDEREGLLLIPKHKVVVDEFYKTPQVHEQEFKQALANLKVGQRFTRDIHGVRRETVQMLGDPWPLGLTKIRTVKAIKRLQNSPLLTPVPSQACSSPPTAERDSTPGSGSTPAPWMTSTTSSPPTTGRNSTWRKRRGGRKSSS